MSDAQWYFEYHSLQKREEEITDAISIASKLGIVNIRETLIQLFGLDSFSSDEDSREIDIGSGVKVNLSSFIPLIWLAGNPDMLSHMSKQRDTEDKIVDAVNDPDFDEFSKALMEGESDMEPFLGSTDPQEQIEELWYSPWMQQTLDSLGVKRTVDRTTPMNISTKVVEKNIPRPNVPNKPKRKVKIVFDG